MASAKRQHLSEDASLDNDAEAIQELENIQQKLDQITNLRSEEILAIERRYNEIRRPVYLERNKLMRKVPDIWLQCLLQHQQISAVIPDSDTDLLSYLEEIDVEDSSDIKSGYKITFTFKDNPFFRNHQLVKELLYSEDNALEVKCTEIDWTPEGLEHQERAEQELVNGRKRKIEETPSFFSWFWQSGEIPEGSDPVSDLIKDELWTNPMSGSADNVQDGEVDGASEDDAAGTLTEGEQYEELYEATGDEGPEGYTDEDMQEQLQDEAADQEPAGAAGEDDDAEEAQAVSDYPDEEAIDDEDLNPSAVVTSATSEEGQQHVQEAAAEALADATGEVALTTDS